MFLIIFMIIGTLTELPNCLYACTSETGIIKSSGNPCNRFASRIESFLPISHNLGVRPAIMVDSFADYILLKEQIKFQTSIEIVKCLTQKRDNANYRILADLLYYFSKDIMVQ